MTEAVTIIDYGMGNLGSIRNMLKKIGIDSKISSDVNQIKKSEKLLLPGVGAFDAAMQRIRESELFEVLNHKVTVEKTPILGICLGMQLLMEGSEEGKLPGFGWIPGFTHLFRFDATNELKIPHMGWNTVQPVRSSPLTNELPADPRFYFVHSYYVLCTNQEDVITRTVHGVAFDSIVNHKNIYGAQFHPEKSHRFGMQLLSNFAAI